MTLDETVRGLRSLVARLRSSFGVTELRAMAPGIIALAFAPFIAPLIHLERNEPLFGDQLVFQYQAWCLRHGLKLYRDMGTADGPLISFLHAAIQIVAGDSDRGFRTCDLVLHGSGAAVMGVLLAPTAGLSHAGRYASRAAWACASAALWLAWYLSLVWEVTCEREAFYSLVGSVGMVAIFASSRGPRRWAPAVLGLGAFLVTMQVFGKPTGVVYAAMGALIVLLPDNTASASRRIRWRTFMLGAGACFAVAVLLLLAFGSLRGYPFWCIHIPYVGNNFLFRIDWHRLVFVDWQPERAMAVVSLIAGTAAIACGWLPVRALGFVLMPLLLFLGACLQGRGYTYQVAPVGGAAHVLMLVAVSNLWSGLGDLPSADARGLVAALAVSLAAYYGFGEIQGSPYRWGGDKDKWDTPVHTFAVDEKRVGAYVREHTKATDPVFAYSAGENAHVVLFTAERRTASPFFHSFWLDPVGLVPQSEIKPDAAELAALTALQTEIRGMACEAVRRNKPAAMVFNLLPQVFKVCPAIEEMLRQDYRDANTIGAFHVYLRK